MSVITIGNFKGGVGKTTVSTLLSYIASERYDKKVLLVDFDPQGNATQIMKRTYPEAIDEKQTFIDVLKNGELEDSIINLSTKLSLIPADSSLANLSDIIAKTDIVKKRYILKLVIVIPYTLEEKGFALLSRGGSGNLKSLSNSVFHGVYCKILT